MLQLEPMACLKPYNPPFIVWLSATNIIAIDDSLSTMPPSGAFG